MLWTKHLVIVYMYLISVGIVFVSYWVNVSTMKAVMSSMEHMQTSILEEILSLNIKVLFDHNSSFCTLAQNYAVQGLLAYVFAYVHLGPRCPFLQKLLPLSFLAPSVLGLLPLPPSFLHHAPVFAALLPLAMVKFVLWYSAFSIAQTLYSGFQHARNFIRYVRIHNIFIKPIFVIYHYFIYHLLCIVLFSK